jgi:mRNA interferase MazF
MEEVVFDQWNEKKKMTNFHGEYPHFLTGQIWWAQLGQNIATEVAGKGNDFLRPVIIVQRLYGNACLAVPLSSQARKGDYYFTFTDSKGKIQHALLAQVRYLDGKRFKYQLSDTKKEDVENLRDALCTLIKK